MFGLGTRSVDRTDDDYTRLIVDVVKSAHNICVPVGILCDKRDNFTESIAFDFISDSYEDLIYDMKFLFDEKWSGQ